MKKTTTLLILSLIFVSTINAQIWGSKKVKGNGNIITETRNTGDYDGIKCAGSMDFILVSGNEGTIKLEGDSNILEYVITEIKNDNLIVKVKNGTNISSSKGIKVTIPFKDIDNVSLAGSGDLISKAQITANKLDVSLAGSGDVVLDIKSNFVKAAIAGSGDMKLKGSTDKLVAKIAGSGDFHGFDLQANNTEVSIAGSGDAEVVSNENLKARVAGSGDIKYKGNPKKDSKVAGSGTIKAN
ncbi:head GIN domain-containing protein [Seonamhaeicola maritimus]|uniref:head GIN domain-containing protein n=1 Tax=Seonamhaeicola maritimus TaxID=2591822 RepID=UPI0024945D63|nr:head GIN domain-containing protein [Seonamhaeicola maritimus]